MNRALGRQVDRASMVVIDSSGGRWHRLIADLAALGIVAFASLFLGMLVNVCRDEPLPWKYRSREQAMDDTVARLREVPALLAPVNPVSEPTHEIPLEEFQPFVEGHLGPVLDARPAVFYRQSHVPGARSLPRETFANDYPRLREQLECYKDKPIAVYCSGPDCPDSQLVTDALTKLGYRRLVIYTGGWEEWSQTGLPQEGAVTVP